MQVYSDPERENDVHALPNVEVFHVPVDCQIEAHDGEEYEEGYYWWACFPGCLPDGDPVGPFETEEEAIEDAQNE